MKRKLLILFLATLMLISAGMPVGHAFINEMTNSLQHQVVPQVQEAAPEAEPEPEPTPEPTPTPISSLKVDIDSDMSALLSWANPSRTLCEVYLHINTPEGLAHAHAIGTLRGTSILTDALMPGVEYTMFVVSEDGVELSKTVAVPEGEPFRENNFRMTKNRVYYFKDGTKRIWNQTFSIVSTTTAAELQERLDQSMEYAVYFDITKRKTSEPLVLLPTVYLQTPDGNVFVTMSSPYDALEIPGSWDGASYYVVISDMLRELLLETEMIDGDYHCHVYHENRLLGSTKFTIKNGK